MSADAGDEHDPLFCPATLKLGEMHWFILRADNLMHAKTIVETRSCESMVIHAERTAFGREVGRDEINWWVFKKEKNVDELRERTHRALDASQTLQRAALAIKSSIPDSYPELLGSLRRFAEAHISEIDALHEYVLWLSVRDVMAPKILYTYRVWGSTRMSERFAKVDPNASDAPQGEGLHFLTEVVLGLASSRLRTIDRAYLEVGEEMWNSRQFDEESNEAIQVPEGRVVRCASRMAFDECATYFTEIRDSLRNILLDIEKFAEQQNLLSSDTFWRAFVEKALRVSIVEPQLWDLKETLPMWHIEKGHEKEKARVAFSEDVASFANARGGVLVIGATDRREVVGIGNKRDVENRLKSASEVLKKHLEYARLIFRFHQLVLLGKDREEKICLLVIVAQACEVVGVNDGEAHYTYPVRRETGIKRESSHDLAMPKAHLKSDNYDFLSDLNQFVVDKDS